MQLIFAATLLLVVMATSSASEAAAREDGSSSNDLERELQASLAAASIGPAASSSSEASSDKHVNKQNLQQKSQQKQQHEQKNEQQQQQQQQQQHGQQADRKPTVGSSRQQKQPLKVRETKEHAVSRQELRELFKKLLTNSERSSLSVRIDPAEVKRTINEMKDKVRYSYDRSAMKRKAAAGAAAGSEHSHAAVSAERKKKMQQQQQQHKHHQQLQQRALRMRRSLLANSQESVMASKRARRRKRDLPDYSPEEYEALMRELAADQEGLGEAEGEGYEQDADGAIRLLEQSLPLLQEQRRSMPPPPPPEPKEFLDDSVDDNIADTADGLYDLPQSPAAALLLPPPPPPPQEDAGIEEPWLPAPADNFDSSDNGNEDAIGEPIEEANRPLTMFLVRVAGERGLFLPLDQRAAASAASAIASGQLAVSDRDLTIDEPEESDELLRAAAAEEGQRELRRFAEKLARRLPAEQLL